MNGKSNNEKLVQRVQELESIASLWIAANEAKDERIAELEAECGMLQQRVARLSRQAGRRQQPSKVQQISNAR